MWLSLTHRLVLLVVLALAGLGAATLAILRVHGESDAVREATAFAQADSVAQELWTKRDGLPDGLAEKIAKGEAEPSTLRALAAALLAPLADASAGYCSPNGSFLVRETVVPRDLSPALPDQRPPPDEGLRGNIHHADGMGLLPLDRDVVVAACRAHTGGSVSHVRFVAPRDVLLLAVAGGHAPFAAWALVRTPKRVHTSAALASSGLIGVIALSMVALVFLSVDTVLQLRSGIGSLSAAMAAARVDLGAPIPRPKARELARLSDGLRTMTAHVKEARQREVALERRLAHELRLASLGRIAAGLAHEIRNPLAGIKLRLDAMARRRLDERSARDARRALDEVARLDGVVGSLLLIARREPAPSQEVDLAALVDERLAVLEGFASQRQVRLVRDGAAQARLDPAGIARVIDNLVRNGVEASPRAAEVVVELRVSSADLVMRVVDAGDGVPPPREGELFEPFFTSKPDGTGLGLSLSRAAVEAHGGTLTYLRDQDRTSFVVRLPGRAVA